MDYITLITNGAEPPMHQPKRMNENAVFDKGKFAKLKSYMISLLLQWVINHK
jgi:hypothetical protein